MENLTAFIDAVPVIFSYFIPGYVYIWVRKQLNHGKQGDSLELLFVSVVTTFILNLAMAVIFNTFGWSDVMNRSLGFNGAYTYGNLAAVIFATICGYLSCQLREGKAVVFLKKTLKLKGTVYPTVWDVALTKPAWVTVYLDELNICYMGRVQYIQTDPEIDKRDIYMTKYKAYAINDNMKELVNHGSDKNGIYIDCKNVSRIEVLDDNERACFS